MSLRARLLLVTVGLVAAGLLIADVVTYRALSSSLIRRVDQQLAQAQPFAIAALRQEGDGGPLPGDPGPLGDIGPPAGSYACVLDASGTVVTDHFFGYGPGGTHVVPALPGGLPGSTADGVGVAYLTTDADGGGGSFRVQATGPVGGRGTLVVAIPLNDVEATLRRLIGIEALVSIVVIAIAGGSALWLVRLSLRPLEDIGATAGAIAAGDLSRRVEPADDATEVGRLGASLNAMLAQIEAAFEERRASEERLRRFVGDASHELRTPLTSIRGYAELFRRGAGRRPEDLARSMARIEGEAERMGVLVDDLLLLARLDQGRPLEREPVDLAAIVADAVDAARAIDPGRSLAVRADGPAVVLGDAGRLRQVIDNLLENARAHTPLGTATHVAVSSDAAGARVVVADEGPGMDPEVAANAFERFYRGDPARARSTGGAGLGLAIVAAIVEAHGGAVRVDPNAAGTTIVVTVPAAPAHRPDEASAP